MRVEMEKVSSLGSYLANMFVSIFSMFRVRTSGPINEGLKIKSVAYSSQGNHTGQLDFRN